jgi:hypothetical protein
MKIIKGVPPNIEKIKKKFNLTGINVVFTYGDTIYSPHSDKLPEHLIVHERVHEKQQGKEPEQWWNRYLSEDNFRIQQESEAYRTQYNFVAPKVSRQQRRQFLKELATSFSSKMYGSILTFNQAKELICPN